MLFKPRANPADINVVDDYVVSVVRLGPLRWRWSVSALVDRHGNFAGEALTRSAARRSAQRLVRDRFLNDEIASRSRANVAA